MVPSRVVSSTSGGDEDGEGILDINVFDVPLVEGGIADEGVVVLFVAEIAEVTEQTAVEEGAALLKEIARGVVPTDAGECFVVDDLLEPFADCHHALVRGFIT